MHLHLALDQFWRIAELRHVAAKEGTLATVHLHLDPDDELVATATNSMLLAQWRLEAEYDSFVLDDPVLLSAAALGEAIGALQSMVKIDRGKFDPVGWTARLTSDGGDVAVAAFDPFGERRGDIMVPVFNGDYPKYERLFDTKPKGLDSVGVSPKQLVALAKTTTDPDRRLSLVFRGDQASVVRAFAEKHWRGLASPIKESE